MLASDLNNPEFAGAQNPDSLLQVEFYMHAAEDTWKTNETGIKAYRPECPFIRISIPGNQLSMVERPADGRDPQRFPREWLIFQMKTGQVNQSQDIASDTPLSALGLDAETIRQLEYLRFTSVEKLAHANDMQIQGIGNGGVGLRDKSRAFLGEQKASNARKEIDERDARIKSLEEKLDKVLGAMEEQTKRGPGRPKNDERLAA
jgi:hypothetical protein